MSRILLKALKGYWFLASTLGGILVSLAIVGLLLTLIPDLISITAIILYQWSQS